VLVAKDTVRVRLIDAGRGLVARGDRVHARLLALAARRRTEIGRKLAMSLRPPTGLGRNETR
jgi:hypothetical protein